MIVSRERKVLFVHVQKTGGSTIDRVLMERLPGAKAVRRLDDDRHATWQMAIEHRPAFAEFWTFGFVRNPWARMDSWYRMIQRRVVRANENPEGRAARTMERNEFWNDVIEHHPTFESFVLEGPDRIPRLRRPQLHYLQTEGADGGRRADFIGRTESLDDDLAKVFDHLGLPAPERVPRANSSRTKTDWHDAYTPEMRDRIGELFQVDVDEFGYDF